MSSQSKDFSGQNVRGRSFKGQNLEGANFSHADIRSTNFIGANLRGANFTGAKAGLQKRWAVFLVIISCLLLAISGFLFLFYGAFMAIIISALLNSSQNIDNQIIGWTGLIATIIIYIIIRQKIEVKVVLVFPVAVAAALAGVGDDTLPRKFTFAVVIAVVSTFALAAVFALTRILAFASGVGEFAGPFALYLIFISSFPLALGFVFALAGAFAGAEVASGAIKGDKKYNLVRNIAVALTTIGGTSFRGADLTDANFTSARLKSTDFREAKLIRTCFHKTKKHKYS